MSSGWCLSREPAHTAVLSDQRKGKGKETGGRKSLSRGLPEHNPDGPKHQEPHRRNQDFFQPGAGRTLNEVEHFPNPVGTDDSPSKGEWLEHGWRQHPVDTERLYDLIFDPPGDDPAFEMHLSCSDPFTGGWGQSAGPVEGVDVNWQIAFFSIARYNNQGFFKNCGYMFVNLGHYDYLPS